MGGPIWLAGMMGAGKTAVGRSLARRLGRRFVDTDERVEKSAGMTISEIFGSLGEANFRTRERAVLDELCAGDDVVSLGGGALAGPGVAERLAGSGRVVYLRASIDTLLRRIGDGSSRPLLAELDPAARRKRLEELLQRRQVAYESAQLSVDTDARDVAAVVDAILAGLNEIGLDETGVGP
jgi:3-dehydroquinate synthase